jgi:hypothetical protein
MKGDEFVRLESAVTAATKIYKDLDVSYKENMARLQVVYLMMEFYNYLDEKRPAYKKKTPDSLVKSFSKFDLIKDVVFANRNVPLHYQMPDAETTENDLTFEESKEIDRIIKGGVNFQVAPFDDDLLQIKIIQYDIWDHNFQYAAVIYVKMRVDDSRRYHSHITIEPFTKPDFKLDETMEEIDRKIHELMLNCLRREIELVI